MKKLVLLSLISIMFSSMWASDPVHTTRIFKKPIPTPAGAKPSSKHQHRNNPKNLIVGSLQTVQLGTAANMLTVFTSACHQIPVDSVLNTVLFIHRSDSSAGIDVAGISYNVAQFRYDISHDGGNTWQLNIGPLNPHADNQEFGINSRYPEAMIQRDTTQGSPDSSYLVYSGTWWTGANSTWQGQNYGAGQLSGNLAGFTEHYDTVDNTQVYVSESMVQSTYGHYFDVNLNYNLMSPTSGTDSIYGLVIYSGVWNNAANEVQWTYQNFPINTTQITNGNGGTQSTLDEPTIAFDPTGKYGWIVAEGDTSTTNSSDVPIILHSTDYGATWSMFAVLDMDNLPGMFPTLVGLNNLGHTLIGSCEVAVDSAGNPHIMAVVGQNDTTTGPDWYPFAQLALYDLYYNQAAAASGCGWQANMLSPIFGTWQNYTSLPYNQNGGAYTDNRVQVARSNDGKKLFVFWDDSDSGVVAATNTGASGQTNFNPNPNLLGIGIDMGSRKTTQVKNFTAGDPMWGGQIPSLGLANGTEGGAIYPVVSQNVLIKTNDTMNIPVILTQPDYRVPIASSSSDNPARFFYCKNINFVQSDFVNKFDNAPPTLDVASGDTVWVHLDSIYTIPRDSAFDCLYGSVPVHYTSNVPLDVNQRTDSIGIFSTIFTATSPDSNTATFTQTVIVAQAPIARIMDRWVSGTHNTETFGFIDTSLYFPNTLDWNWGDGTAHDLNPSDTHKNHTYQLTSGQKTVILTVSNIFGSSQDTVYINVELGINDVELAGKINVYPNPANGQITVSLPDGLTDGANLLVYNSLGELVNEPITIMPNVLTTPVDLHKLEGGVYMLKIETSQGTAIKQISIIK